MSVIRLRDKLGHIQLGQAVEIVTDDCPKQGSLQQLDGDVTIDLGRGREFEHNARSVTVRVIEAWQHKEGGFVVRCKVRYIGDLPEMLHKRPWKPPTHDPLQAARDEPEGVTPAVVADLTERSRVRMSAIKADEERRREARSIGNRTKETIARARLHGVDVDENLHRLREELDEITRKTENAA